MFPLLECFKCVTKKKANFIDDKVKQQSINIMAQHKVCSSKKSNKKEKFVMSTMFDVDVELEFFI